jgi:hypothetical protein
LEEKNAHFDKYNGKAFEVFLSSTDRAMMGVELGWPLLVAMQKHDFKFLL